MGGVDLLDRLIGIYRIKMRPRKWYMRLFYHILKIVIINAWLLYRRSNEGKQNLLKLADFRIDLASTLCMIGNSCTPKRGREAKRKKPNVGSLPPKDVRLESANHFPIWNSSRLRCKHPSCKPLLYVKNVVQLCVLIRTKTVSSHFTLNKYTKI